MREWLGEAQDFLKGIVQKKVRTYNPSTNSVTVAGMKLDGVVSATLTENQRTQGVVGVDQQYYAVTEVNAGRTFNVELLPTAMCYKQLVKLDKATKIHKAFFTLSVIENGGVVEQYDAHIVSLSATNLTQETSNKSVVFGVKQKLGGKTVVVEFETDLSTQIDSELESLQ